MTMGNYSNSIYGLPWSGSDSELEFGEGDFHCLFHLNIIVCYKKNSAPPGNVPDLGEFKDNSATV